LIVETSGKGAPPWKIRRSPAPVGPVTVTLKETAFALAGIPHRPVRTNIRVVPPTSAGPAAPRVSRARQGASVKKLTAEPPPNGVGVRVGVRVGVNVGPPGVIVDVNVGVRVGVSVGVAVRVGVRVNVKVGVRVGVDVLVGVRVGVGVPPPPPGHVPGPVYAAQGTQTPSTVSV
jgi:hypothetical protein